MFKFLGSSSRKLNKDYVIAAADKVPLSQRLGYGLGTFMDMWGHWLYPNLAGQIFQVYLGVAPTLVGIAVMLNRLFDAVSDPLFGWWSDNTRTRFGRRRPFILVGSILAGIGLPFLLAVTPGWGSSHIFGYEVSNYFWFMLISSALYLPIVSCFNMPYQSLANELTPDYHERTKVFAFKNGVQKIPEVGLFFAGQFFSLAIWEGATNQNVFERLKLVPGAVIERLKLLLFTPPSGWSGLPEGQPNMLLGAQVYCAILGVIMILAGIGVFVLVKERLYGKLVVGKQERISMKETLWQTLQCRPFRVQITMALAYSLGLSMVGTLGWYDTIYYVCGGRVTEGNGWNFLMGLSGMVFGFLGLPVFATIARHLGKRHAMLCVQGAAIVVFISTWWLYNPEIRWIQIFASGLIAFTGAGFYMLDGSMRADVIDYDELETGKRREGAFSACHSWITKVGMAVGAGVSFFILDWIGFDRDLGGNQSEQTFFMIRFLLASIPVVGLLIAMTALSRFPLSQERMAEIRTQLEARRGKV